MMSKALVNDSTHKAARRPRIASPLAEWAGVQTVEQLFGIKETALYELIRERAIRSILMKKPGRARGKRLVSLASVRDYLANLEAK
jgi:hypothetical protein